MQRVPAGQPRLNSGTSVEGDVAQAADAAHLLHDVCKVTMLFEVDGSLCRWVHLGVLEAGFVQDLQKRVAPATGEPCHHLGTNALKQAHLDESCLLQPIVPALVIKLQKRQQLLLRVLLPQSKQAAPRNSLLEEAAAYKSQTRRRCCSPHYPQPVS